MSVLTRVEERHAAMLEQRQAQREQLRPIRGKDYAAKEWSARMMEVIRNAPPVQRDEQVRDIR